MGTTHQRTLFEGLVRLLQVKESCAEAMLTQGKEDALKDAPQDEGFTEVLNVYTSYRYF